METYTRTIKESAPLNCERTYAALEKLRTSLDSIKPSFVEHAERRVDRARDKPGEDPDSNETLTTIIHRYEFPTGLVRVETTINQPDFPTNEGVENVPPATSSITVTLYGLAAKPTLDEEIRKTILANGLRCIYNSQEQ